MPFSYTDLLVQIRKLDADTGAYPVVANPAAGGAQYNGRLDQAALPKAAPTSDGYGSALFLALFAGEVRDALIVARDRATAETRGHLRLRLCIEPGASELHAYVWERLVLAGDAQAPLAIEEETPFSRFSASKLAEQAPITDRPIRILFAIANPEELPVGLAEVPVEEEVSSLRRALGDLGGDSTFRVTVMPGRSGLSSELRSDLLKSGYRIVEGRTSLDGIVGELQAATGYHVLHVVAHGSFRGRASGEGTASMFLEDLDRGPAGEKSVPTEDSAIVPVLRSLGDLLPALVFLQACQSGTARGSAIHPFVGLGPKLVEAGVPAVVAMQDLVPIPVARKLTGEFYRGLHRHGVVDLALNQARRLVYMPEDGDWAIPVLFTRLVGGRLFSTDVTSILRAIGPGESRVRELVEYHRPLFWGRIAQLAALDSFLEGDRPYGFLYQPYGRGKTALLVRWASDIEAQGEWTVVFVPISRYFETASASDLVALQMLAHGLCRAYGEELPRQGQSLDDLRSVIATLLENEPPQGVRLLVVVDGVDKTLGWRWPTEIFPRQPPPRVRCVVSSRLVPDGIVEQGLQNVGWSVDRLRPEMVELLDVPPLDQAEVGEVLRLAGLTADSALLAEVMAISGGEPVRVRVLAEDLRDRRISPEQLTSLRGGWNKYLRLSGSGKAERLGEGAVDRPFINRQQAVDLLRAKVHGTAQARSSLELALIGESGVGKSRVVERTVSAAEELDLFVLQVQCAGQNAEGLLPFRDSLASYLGRGAERIQEILVRAGPTLADYTPFLQTFLQGTGAATAGAPQLGGAGPEGIHAGLAEFLLGLANQWGLCLVVEDLTDADPQTLAFLNYFRRKARSSRTVTISTVREDLLERQLEDTLDAWQSDGLEVSSVEPLEREDAIAFISLLWTRPPLDEQLAGRIYDLAGGNPFFIEQVVGLVTDDAEEGGVWADDPSKIVIPERIEAVLQRRLRRVDREARQFLDAAAVVLETSHDLEAIRYVLDVDQKTVLDLLRRASELHCIIEDAEGGVTFEQDLLRRAVYGDLGAQARKFLHGRAAEWFEEEGQLAAAAHHFGAAGRTPDLVRTALEGAARAEHVGMYQAALQLYERARPFVAIAELGPKLCNAYLVVGRWDDAEELLQQLPSQSLPVRRVRSDLSFLRGDFSGALREMDRIAKETPAAERTESLVRLAEINLYLGEFEAASRYAAQALPDAKQAAAIAIQARCQGVHAATMFFSGGVDEGEALLQETMTLLSSQPIEERDHQEYTTILGNLGQVHEAREDWEGGKGHHEEALRLRRAVSDARGVLQSTHALARTQIGLGAVEPAVGLLKESWRMARRLGDKLEEGKIRHTCADLKCRLGRSSSAVRFATRALQQYRDSAVAYDVAHARFSLARAYAGERAERPAIEEGARARAETERKGFGLLARLFPDLGFSYSGRISGGLVAYACGDAIGLPWEGRPAREIDAARVESIPVSADWPRGATSDDTALTLLIAEQLVKAGGADGLAFMRRLAEMAPSIKGLGPSTTRAVDYFRTTGELPVGDGNTNGAVMRALPVGWAVPVERPDLRREWTIRLSRATHPGAEACCAGCVASACASWAIEGASPTLLLDVAREEASAARQACGADEQIEGMLAELAEGTWTPDPNGITLHPYETIVAALWCIATNGNLRDALLAAVRLGGDTDTVAAIVGGLLGCRYAAEDVRAQLPWSNLVLAPDAQLVQRLSDGIARLRIGGVDG